MEDVTDGTKDKRSWRERLGIGKGASNLPKLEDEMRQSSAASPSDDAKTDAAAKSHTPARPAPMAPRVAAKPAPAARPAPVSAASALFGKDAKPASGAVQPSAAKPAQPLRQPPVAADALASKLRDQREAAERLALQRVAAAKQKAEGSASAAPQAPAATAMPTPRPAAEKPKFSFADAGQPAAEKAPPPPQQAQQRPPQQQQRPAQPFPPQMPQDAARRMPPQPAMAPPPMQPARQPLGVNPGLPPQPAYGAAPGRFQPQGYRPIDPAGSYAPQPPGYRPRPNMAVPYQDPLGQPRGYRPPPPRYPEPVQRGPMMPMGPAVQPYQDDVFEDMPRSQQRRATAGEYQQAYRDEYLEDDRKGMGWGVWVAALALAILVALGAVYALKPQLLGKTGLTGMAGKPAVVEAPATTAKSAPDATAPAAADQVARKQIYDRIEGDHEVPGGQLKGSEQAPQPAGQAAPPPSGDNAVPLPLPPPPGTGQQGALSPNDKGDITPANDTAAAPSAADSSQIAVQTTPNAPLAPGQDQNLQANDAQSPSGVAAVGNLGATAPKPLDAIVPAPAAPPTATKPAAAASATKPASDAQPPAKKPKLITQSKFKSLGSKPVVLVSPGGAASAAPVTPAPIAPVAQSSGGGATDLYGNSTGGAVPAAPAAKVASAAPAPAVPATPVGTGYEVQLASYASKADAQAAYAQLAAKHGGVVSRYTPIIEATQVAGSTRYRLNLGPIANSETAASVCATLIAAGERDCLTKKQ